LALVDGAYHDVTEPGFDMFMNKVGLRKLTATISFVW
jgi:hypothetical protein